MNKWKDQILQSARAMEKELAGWRRELHKHPETGFDLAFTKAFVRARLEEMGCRPVDCGKAGLTVLLGKGGGSTVLLRADMDALPVTEEAEIDFASENSGRMHACGHDMHTAMLLGAARLLKEREEQLDGYVKLMFQPAEELFCGAKDMIECGVLKDPDVDAALMIHVLTGLPVPKGCIMVPSGGIGSASCDIFRITVRGKGGHGAMPQLSIDPINAMVHIHTSLQAIHAREVTPGEFLVITPGIFHAGNANNVIPDTAVMEGTIRTADAHVAEFARQRLTEIAEATAQAFRCEGGVEWLNSCPPMANSEEVSAAARTYLTELLGDAILPPVSGGNPGASEDFAYVSAQVPALGIYLGAGSTAEGYPFPQHHPRARFDDSVLDLGAAAYAWFALRWLQEHPKQ